MPKRKAATKQEPTAKKSKTTNETAKKELQLKAIEELFILAREDRFLNNDISVLHLASLVGQEELVRYLVTSLGAKLNVRARRGETPLHMIACNGGKTSITIAKTLVELGAEIDAKDSRGFTPLMFAAFNGDIKLAKLLVEMGASIHSTCSNGLTVLHYAAMQNHFEIVQELVKVGVSVDSVEVRGYTPLHLAVVYGRTKLVEYLVKDAGADLTKRDPQGFDVLQIAFQKGDKEMARLLLRQKAIRDRTSALHICAAVGTIKSLRALVKKGAQVDAINERKHTPLHWAAMAGNLKTAQELIKLGADHNAQDDKVLTPMHWAAMTGHETVVKALKEAGADFLDDNRGHTPLHCAAEYYGICAASSAEAVIRTLVKLGADMEARTDVGCSPLHIAVHHDHQDAAKLLVDLGAEVNAVDNKEFTPLHHAALEGRTSVISALLNLGAELEAKNENGLTPLHVAAFKGHTEAVRVLVAWGADLRVKNEDQQTALHMASIKGHMETVRYFLDIGVSTVTESDGDGLSATHDAARNGQFEITKYLVEMKHFRNVNDKRLLIHSAAYGGNVELVEYLLQQGLDVFSTEKDNTTIHSAAMNGKHEVVALLAKKGVPVNAKGPKKQTALHISAELGHVDTVKLLLDLGAEKDCKCEDGKTPLFYAAAEGRAEVVEELAKRGAKVNAVSKGVKALSVASARGFVDVAKVLFSFGVKPTSVPALAKEEECTICFEKVKYKMKLPCNHSFCYLCVVGVNGGKEPKCPHCRNPFVVTF